MFLLFLLLMFIFFVMFVAAGVSLSRRFVQLLNKSVEHYFEYLKFSFAKSGSKRRLYFNVSIFVLTAKNACSAGGFLDPRLMVSLGTLWVS